MKISSKKQKKNFHPDVGTDRKLTSGEKFKEKKNQPSVFSKKRNPLSFVVAWQLHDK
ncbi:MAG: hypothetical protein ACQETJ_11115 [Bacteroidota bacterium]